MKELLCRAYCEALEVRKVPAGFAVRTPYSTSDGDPLLVYFIRTEDGRIRLEDDGSQVPMLEANGVDLAKGTRARVFETLLSEYSAYFDRDKRTIFTSPLSEEEVGAATVSFSALLLRLQDLFLLAAPVVRNVFREDAIAAIHATFDGVAEVEDKGSVAEEMVGAGADVVVRPPSAPPLAIFIGTSEERALNALVSKMDAQAYRRIKSSVALLVERAKVNPIKESTLALAQARLDRVLSFRGTERDAMDGLAMMAGVVPMPLSA